MERIQREYVPNGTYSTVQDASFDTLVDMLRRNLKLKEPSLFLDRLLLNEFFFQIFNINI